MGMIIRKPGTSLPKLPKGVVKDRDRYGGYRLYFRAPGRPKVRLNETPGTDAFEEEVSCARLGIKYVPAGASAEKTGPTRTPSKYHSFDWLIDQYEKRSRGRMTDAELDRKVRMLREVANYEWPTKKGGTVRVGSLPFDGMQRKHVVRIRDDIRQTPGARNNVLKALSALYSWAIKNGEAKESPTASLTREYSGEGFHTVTEEEIRQYEQHHPLGTMPNLAMRLALYTGLRRSDLAKLGPEHIINGRIEYRPSKTRRSSGIDISLPILPPLLEAIEATSPKGSTFLLNGYNRPYTENGLGNKAREWFDQAGLHHCSLHGLRKAGPSIAAENGATHEQLKAIWGWVTDAQASHYIRKANRKKLADAGMKFLRLGVEKGAQNVQPEKGSEKVGQKPEKVQ